MKKNILLLFTLALPVMLSAQVSVHSLRTNGLDEAYGVSGESPVLSWILSSDRDNTFQKAYQVTVSSPKGSVWNSGKVESSNSTAVPVTARLDNATYYTWTVRVWDNYGRESKTVKSFFVTGLDEKDWKAEWIGIDRNPHPVYLKKEFRSKEKIARAIMYVTSRGLYEAYIDGNRVGDYCLTPGWTSYKYRIQYQAYDVTKMLRSGSTVSALVAPGWYSGGINFGKPEKRFKYGQDVALRMHIEIVYTSGKRESFVTDSSWLASDGEVTFANIYDGETINHLARNSWSQAKVLPATEAKIVPTENEPIRRHKPINPLKLIKTPKGETVIDFGQNMSGWEKIRVRGQKGDTIKVYHAEILDNKGNFYTKNLRRAKATSTYILSGDGVEEFEPTMTFYGFRYIKIVGLREEVNLSDYQAIPVYSSFREIGHFASSNEVINKLQSNIEWGFRSNFLDVPTDCPQRDERLGWTGDAQVFFRTASFLGDVSTFFKKWLSDLALDQWENGRVPRVIPDTFPNDLHRTTSAGWADAAVIIPWNLYMSSGDVSVLARQWESMKKWTDYMVYECYDKGMLYNTGTQHFGDWLFYSKQNDPDGQSAVTSKHLIAQCFFTHALDVMARVSEILGKKDFIEHYTNLARLAREAYMKEYVTPNGLISSNTQTAYVLALEFDMLPEELRAQAARRLVNSIREYKTHITTGFLGTPYICHQLSRYGYTDVAYELLLQKTCPSWIYPVLMGATTIWERWDSMNPDGTLPPMSMNSFNHYSYGAIGDWLYRSAVGIQETEPGYRRIKIEPNTGGDFTWMEASTHTPYGKVGARWEADKNQLKTLDVEIPVGVEATIVLPRNGDKLPVSSKQSLKFISSDDKVQCVVGSGKYHFDL